MGYDFVFDTIGELFDDCTILEAKAIENEIKLFMNDLILTKLLDKKKK